MQTVVLRVKHANTILEKSIGLIGSEPKNLFFKTRFGIHTFGMKFPIDVIVLDSKNIVRATKQNLKPNRIFVWNPKFNIVIELKQGTIEKNSIQVGSQIKIFYI